MAEQAQLTAAEFAEAFSNGFLVTVRYMVKHHGCSDYEANEAAQAAWARAWEKRAMLRNKAKLRNWVISIAKNVDRSRRRRAAFLRETPADCDTFAGPERPLASGVDFDKLLADVEVRDKLILTQFYQEGKACGEIARDLKARPSTVRVRMMRAKRKLRRLLEGARN